MIKNFTKFMAIAWQNYLSVALFISGMVLIDIGAFYFSFIVGTIITGITLIVMAVILDQERRE